VCVCVCVDRAYLVIVPPTPALLLLGCINVGLLCHAGNHLYETLQHN
jgi:hypothetical protein